jgi:hypothetical protein
MPLLKKNDFLYWQRRLCVVIVLVLFFFLGAFGSAVEATVSTSLAPVLPQSNKETEQRIVELELELARVRKELGQQRAQYAAFYERSHAVLEQMRELELHSAHLLQRKDGEDTAALASQALSALGELGARQLEVEQSLGEFERYLETMLDVMQPSDAVRREVSERVSALRGVVERSLNPLSIVAGRGSGKSGMSGCAVLAVDDELQLVILDGGFLNGVRAGSQWWQARGAKVILKLRVVDARPEISAAVLLQGTLAEVAVGSRFQSE